MIKFDSIIYLNTEKFSVKPGKTRKLSSLYTGPFEVGGIVSPMAYKVKMPNDMKRKIMFHVSNLTHALHFLR